MKNAPKKSIQKLILHKETIAQLDSQASSAIKGGDTGGSGRYCGVPAKPIIRTRLP